MFCTFKELNVRKLESELLDACKNNKIFCFTHINEPSSLTDESRIVGVEVIFSDGITYEQVQKVKHYIEHTYKFCVDDTTFMSPIESLKIIIVRYDYADGNTSTYDSAKGA